MFIFLLFWGGVGGGGRFFVLGGVAFPTQKEWVGLFLCHICGCYIYGNLAMDERLLHVFFFGTWKRGNPEKNFFAGLSETMIIQDILLSLQSCAGVRIAEE